jgi:hypothetical protein
MEFAVIVRTLSVVVVGIMALSGCEREGPAERAGARIDDAVNEARDRFEDARDEVEDTVEEIRESVEEE